MAKRRPRVVLRVVGGRDDVRHAYPRANPSGVPADAALSIGGAHERAFPQYSVTRDGQQFLMIDPVAEPRVQNLTVIAHWTETLKR